MVQLLLALGVCIGCIAYFTYLRFIFKRPQWLVYFILFAWPLLEYANLCLFTYGGINAHWRLFMIALFVIPAVSVLVMNLKVLWRSIPSFKYCLLFCAWLMGYFVFYNNHTVDNRQIMNSWTDSMDVAMVVAYVSLLLAMASAATAVLKHPEPHKFFDGLNKALLVFSSGVALISIIGYPLGFWTLEVEGFTRSTGLYSHPNPFAHHQGMLLLYLLGLLGYYHAEKKGRISMGLLYSAFFLNGVALALALSKTALAVFTVCVVLWLALNITSPKVRKACILFLPLVVVAIGLSLWGFQALTDKNFLDVLEARVDQTQSLSWRELVWKGLLDNMSWMSMGLGHGFTSANEWVLQLTYNNRLNSKPLILVHNGYINLVYDLGVMGLLLFGSAITFAGKGFLRVWQAHNEQERFVFSTIVVMAIYFLAVSYFDEMAYMFDAPMVFFALATILWCLYLPSSRDVCIPSLMPRSEYAVDHVTAEVLHESS